MLLYMLQVIGYTMLMWFIYHATLYNNPLHRFSRVFLLLSCLLPLVLPFLKWNYLNEITPVALHISLPEIKVSGRGNNETMGGLSRFTMLAFIYLAGTVWISIRQISAHIRFRNFLKKQERVAIATGQVYIHTGHGPGSYGKKIFFPAASIDPMILRHEQAHVAYGHFYDLVFLQVMKALCWPNIFLYLVARELQLVHEYEADQQALQNDAPAYTSKLLANVLGVSSFSIAHSFFQHPIKRRIIMLQQTSGQQARLRIAATAIALTAVFSVSALWAQTVKKSKPKVASPTAQAFNYVQQMPEFKGNVTEYLATHLVYPEKARNAGIEGRVALRFIIGTKGQVEHPEVVRTSGNELLDREALRVVSHMPNWKPGRNNGKIVKVYFTLPISFKLD